MNKQLHDNIVYLANEALRCLDVDSRNELDISFAKSCLLHILMGLKSYSNALNE